MVPLASLVTVRYSSGAGLDGALQQPAGREDPRARRRPASRRARRSRAVEAIAAEVLPPDFSFDWGGTSFQEKEAAARPSRAGARRDHGVPDPRGAVREVVAAALGAAGAAVRDLRRAGRDLGQEPSIPFLGGTPLTNDVYFQIGLVTLLGLAAKNAILIVEFAQLKHDEGLSPSAAAIEAARLRFRPILMTSLAFILGVLPLAISTGAGAGARHSVGTGVMGGMIAATLLAVFHRAAVLQGALRAQPAGATLPRRAGRRGRAPAPRLAHAAAHARSPAGRPRGARNMSAPGRPKREFRPGARQRGG